MPTASRAENTLSEISLDSLFQKIHAVGFPLVGAVDLDLAAELFQTHSKRYQEWIEAGFHGEMQYLSRGLERRSNPRIVFPETESVIVAAIPYRRNSVDPTADLSDQPRYARYLEGPDYHTHLPTLLTTALESWIQETSETAKWKICVDTSAVLERSWAVLAGLGWIGKNTLLIHPKLGSYLFIAVVLLDKKTGRAPNLLPNYCGNCTRCLTSCPTEAFVAPGKMDARKCIAYLTLEKKGEWPEEIKPAAPKMGTWIAGCDICQEVCPYNFKPAKLPETWPSDDRDSALIRDWKRIEDETEEAYRARVKESALSRIKFLGMQRNLKNALRNAGHEEKS